MSFFLSSRPIDVNIKISNPEDNWEMKISNAKDNWEMKILNARNNWAIKISNVENNSENSVKCHSPPPPCVKQEEQIIPKKKMFWILSVHFNLEAFDRVEALELPIFQRAKDHLQCDSLQTSTMQWSCASQKGLNLMTRWSLLSTDCCLVTFYDLP